MKIKRIEWVERLTKLSAAISNSTITPAYSCFLFSNGKITTSNGVLTMSTPTALAPEKGVYVPAAHLMKLLTSLSEDEVELIFEENVLKVKTNRLKGKLTTIPEVIEDKKEPKLTAIEETSYLDFIDGAQFCRTVASLDVTTGPTTGVHIDGRWVFGTDRYRIFTWKRDVFPDQEIKCTLPVVFADILEKYKEEVRSIFVYVLADSTVDHIEATLNDSTIISSTVIAGEYENVIRFFPDEKEEQIAIAFNDEFVQAVNRQAAFLSNIVATNRELIVTIKEGKCSFHVFNSDYGTLDETIDMEAAENDSEVTFCVNPGLIVDALNSVTVDERRLIYYPKLNLLIVEGGECKCLLPTRVQEEEKKNGE